MHTVSVVTLLLGSIFAYSLASPQFYGSNLAGLSTALAQLASQLAAQERNETIKVGNNSVIVSGISSATANVNTDRHNRPYFNNNNNGFYNGFYNGYYNNYGYNGLWRGVPEEDNLSEEEAALAEEEKEVDALSAEANQMEDDEDVDQDDEQDEEHEEEQDEGHEEEQDEGHEEEQEQPQEH